MKHPRRRILALSAWFLVALGFAQGEAAAGGAGAADQPKGGTRASSTVAQTQPAGQRWEATVVPPGGAGIAVTAARR